MKKQVLVILIALLSLGITNGLAQEIEVVDSICVDELGVDSISVEDLFSEKPQVTQYDLKECEWVEICYNPKYAIVTKNGKKGIYDMVLHKNVTEIEFRDLGFSKQTTAEDSASISIFYATKGIKRGIVSLYEPTNDVVSIWMDDPDEVYSLDECTTIDKKVTKKAEKLLEGLMRQQQMETAQIVILNAISGQLKVWIRQDRDAEKEEAGKLLAHSCCGSLVKPFQTVMALENDGLGLDSICSGVTYRQAIQCIENSVMQHAIKNGYTRKIAERKWREMTDTGEPSTSPFIIAVGYNSLAHDGTMIIPTLKADSVNIEKDVFSETNLANLKDVLRIDKVSSPQLAWLSNDTEWIGYASSEDIYAEDDREHTAAIGKQVQFAGVFPAENPKYTICVVADRLSVDTTPTILQEVVNPLVKWLLKR